MLTRGRIIGERGLVRVKIVRRLSMEFSIDYCEFCRSSFRFKKCCPDCKVLAGDVCGADSSRSE
jgi:hypothetical protein